MAVEDNLDILVAGVEGNRDSLRLVVEGRDIRVEEAAARLSLEDGARGWSVVAVVVVAVAHRRSDTDTESDNKRSMLNSRGLHTGHNPHSRMKNRDPSSCYSVL